MTEHIKSPSSCCWGVRSPDASSDVHLSASWKAWRTGVVGMWCSASRSSILYATGTQRLSDATFGVCPSASQMSWRAGISDEDTVPVEDSSLCVLPPKGHLVHLDPQAWPIILGRICRPIHTVVEPLQRKCHGQHPRRSDRYLQCSPWICMSYSDSPPPSHPSLLSLYAVRGPVGQERRTCPGCKSAVGGPSPVHKLLPLYFV